MKLEDYTKRNLYRCAHCDRLKNANRRSIMFPVIGKFAGGERYRICKDCYVDLMASIEIEKR